MKRRTYRLTGADGVVDVEIERLPGGALEVSETDRFGEPRHSVIVHTWKEARDIAARLVSVAIMEGRV